MDLAGRHLNRFRLVRRMGELFANPISRGMDGYGFREALNPSYGPANLRLLDDRFHKAVICAPSPRVVPANAGTHTPSRYCRAGQQTPFATIQARGYGSRRSPGRHMIRTSNSLA